MPWREMSRRSAFRVAVLYSALVTGSALVVMGILYWQTAGALLREVDSTIDAEIDVLADQYRRSGLAGLRSLVSQRLERTPAGDNVYLLQDPQGLHVIGNLHAWPDEPPEPGGYVQFGLGSQPGPLSTLRPGRGRIVELPDGYRLLVGRDMLEVRVFQERVLSGLGWAMAMTVLLALASAMFVGRSIGVRVARINEAIDEIVSGDLSRRLPTRPEGDELDELTDHVNGMLDRIQELLTSVRQVADNIAHDLRTPLARLKRRLEAGLAQSEDQERHAEELEAALAEADALLATFNALLRIARIEAERRREEFGEIDVRALVLDVAELYRPLAEDAGKRLETTVAAGLSVHGDRDLLFQALANLVDNAVKHAPSGSEIRLVAEPEGATVSLRVEDQGPGIPACERERVFGRLVRLDTSRTTPGSGLGLSLVAAVARLHDGEAAIEDNRPGARAILRLPAGAGVALSAAT